MADLLRMHRDIITVPEAINDLMCEMKSAGYAVERITHISFKISLDDGFVCFWWENGAIYFDAFEV